jgi:hypothetical protein
MQIEREQPGTRLLSVDANNWVCATPREREGCRDVQRSAERGDGGVQNLRAGAVFETLRGIVGVRDTIRFFKSA